MNTRVTCFILFVFLELGAGSRVFYEKFHRIYPGQIRYSKALVRLKSYEYESKNQGKPLLKYNRHTSLFPLTKPIAVVKAPYGYVIFDKHHHFLMGVHFGATTFPIKVVKDYSSLSEKEFLRVAEIDGYIYPYDLYGNYKGLVKDCHLLEDDSNRLFAYLCRKDTGNEMFIWTKNKKETPFIELKIAEILRKEGLVYNPVKHKNDSTFYLEAKRALLKVKVPSISR